jgi:hypothetical protein
MWHVENLMAKTTTTKVRTASGTAVLAARAVLRQRVHKIINPMLQQ